MSSTLRGRRIVWGFGGGIAAYKACAALRLFVHAGAEVRAAMSGSAQHFVSPLTVQALSGGPVLTDVLEPAQEALYGHLDLARAADLAVLAPATANLIARVAHGMGDCAVTTSLLAVRAPVLVAPAMNVAMWENEQVQRNVELLRQSGRFHFVGPASGLLADGDVGFGRLEEPERILAAAEALFRPKDLAGKKVVITAGPTREHFDPVRFLSNPSTGRMGYALAEAARDRGAEVLLLSGPTELADPTGVRVERIVSAEELLAAARQGVAGADYFIAAAAVSDYRPAQRSEQKRKKGEGGEVVELVRTPDVLATISAELRKEGRETTVVGFAAETESMEAYARRKLEEKQLDWIVANQVGGEEGGFADERNRVTVFGKGGEVVELPLAPKREVADRIFDVLTKGEGAG